MSRFVFNFHYAAELGKVIKSRGMEEEISLWLREEDALQEALEESKREGIGKMQEEVLPCHSAFQTI